MRFRLVVIVALMALAAANCAGASSRAEGPSEGIGVHGAWVIEVYDADGAIDETFAFSNDLVATGDDFLADVLTGAATPGDWRIATQTHGQAPSACLNEAGTAETACSIQPPELVTSSNSGVVSLAGSFVADQAGGIAQVNTVNYTCSASTSPDACTGQATYNPVTGTNISLVSIEAGQTVQISVDLSFGTLP